jgi:hypothetical protein
VKRGVPKFSPELIVHMPNILHAIKNTVSRTARVRGLDMKKRPAGQTETAISADTGWNWIPSAWTLLSHVVNRKQGS